MIVQWFVKDSGRFVWRGLNRALAHRIVGGIIEKMVNRITKLIIIFLVIWNYSIAGISEFNRTAFLDIEMTSRDVTLIYSEIRNCSIKVPRHQNNPEAGYYC